MVAPVLKSFQAQVSHRFFFFISQVQETYTVHRLQTTQRKSEKLSRKNDFTSVCWEKRCFSCLTSTVIDQQ